MLQLNGSFNKSGKPKSPNVTTAKCLIMALIDANLKHCVQTVLVHIRPSNVRNLI